MPMPRRMMGIALALVVFAATATPATTLSAETKEYGYVTTELALPANSTEVRTYARDIDGDGDRDNRLGQFFATLANLGLDFHTDMDASIKRGDLLMLQSLRTPSLANTKRASWQVLFAVPTADPDFSRGSFTIDTLAPRSLRLPARIANRRVNAGPGVIPLRLDVLNRIFHLTLKKGKVVATCSRAGCSNGRINGAIADHRLHWYLIELAEHFTALVQRDCTMPGNPDGGCMADSTGKTIFTLFDEDDDLEITEEELQENSSVGRFLAPDLNLVKGDGDRTDALSFGLGFEATPAQLVRP